MKKARQLTNGIILAPHPLVAHTLWLLDKAGTIIRRKRCKPANLDTILLVFFGSFGDGLMFTSILKSLREQKPLARIDVLASRDVASVLQGSPYITNVFSTDMPSGKDYPSRIPGLIKLMRSFGVTYDIAVCFRATIDNGILPLFLSGISRYNVGFSTGGFSFCLDEIAPWRPGIHETEHFLDAVRTICQECELGPQELFYDVPGVAASLDQKLSSLGLLSETPFVIVHPGSKIMRRSLSIDRWRTILTDLVQQTQFTVLVTGIDSEKALLDTIGLTHPRVISTLGLLSIPELTELIKRSSGVVTVETFVSHLAGYAGVPALAYWTGVTDVRQWRPTGQSVTVASVGPPCSPCFRWCDDPICMNHDPSLVMQILPIKNING